MTPKSKKRIIRITAWSLTALLVLAFCPGPVDGNWVMQPPSARNACGCDSHDFYRFQEGFSYSVHGNHPPPIYDGSYRKQFRGGYSASFQASTRRGEISGFATLFFRFEYGAWEDRVEFIYYTRDFHPDTRRVIREQRGNSAWRLGAIAPIPPN